MDAGFFGSVFEGLFKSIITIVAITIIIFAGGGFGLGYYIGKKNGYDSGAKDALSGKLYKTKIDSLTIKQQ